MLIYLFGVPTDFSRSQSTDKSAKGNLKFENAEVDWFLSIDANDLPAGSESSSFHRSILINDSLLDFTAGFDQLHIQSYEAILDESGFGLDDARSSIELVNGIRL